MLLGFKRQFAPFIEEGSKTHTIRAKRKTPPRVGETVHCYTGLRQKGARLLGRWECVKVEDIDIVAPPEYHWTDVGVRMGGVWLDISECNALAWRDGFRNHGQAGAFAEMIAFWDGRLPFHGDIIHWDYSRPVAAGASREHGKSLVGLTIPDRMAACR